MADVSLAERRRLVAGALDLIEDTDPAERNEVMAKALFAFAEALRLTVGPREAARVLYAYADRFAGEMVGQ